jgi:dipeptidyl-peptidase III
VGDRKEDWDDMLYVIWMEMAYAGMKGLQYYDPDTNTWLQAHVTAAYVIMQVFRKAGEDFLTYSFDQRNGKEHFRIHLDRYSISIFNIV